MYMYKYLLQHIYTYVCTHTNVCTISTKSIFQNSNFSMHIIITWSLAREFITLSLTKYSLHHLCHYGSKLLCLNSKDNNGHSNSTSRNTVNLHTVSVNMIINTNTLHTIPTYVHHNTHQWPVVVWVTMEHFTALLYIHSTNRCQLCYFKSDTCFIFLPILSTNTGICTDHTSIGSPQVSCVHTSYVPPAVFVVDNNCQLLTLCQLSTKSFYKYCVHLYYKHVRTKLII